MSWTWRQRSMTALLLCMPLATIFGCKPPAGAQKSEVKTLDNFAAGTKVRTNSCSASPEVKQSPEFSEPMFSATDDRIKIDPSIEGSETRDKLKAEVREALTAISPEMQVAYMSLGGFIDVTPKTKDRCARKFREDDKQKSTEQEIQYITACFQFLRLDKLTDAELADLKLTRKDTVNEDGSPKGGSIMRINVVPDAIEIRHAMVRSFGFLFAQLFARMNEAPEAEKAKGHVLTLGDDENFKIANLKIQVAQNFLVDMIESKIFDLKTMETWLGAGAADQIRKNYEKLKKRGDVSKAIAENFEGVPPGDPKFRDEDLLAGVSYMQKGETQPPTLEQKIVRRVRFNDYVFAEFFDSMKCHPWGDYPSKDVVARVKAGEADRDEFLRSAQNTLAIVQDFFPRTYGMVAATEQEIRALTTTIAQQSPLKKYLKSKEGLGLAEDNLFGDFLSTAAQSQAQAPATRAAGSVAAAPAMAAAGGSIFAMLANMIKNAPKAPQKVQPSQQQQKQQQQQQAAEQGTINSNGV